MTTHQLKNPNASFAKWIGLPFISLIALGILASVGGSGSSGTDDIPVAKTAAEAAEVGDVVIIRYPNLTVMCGDRNDMSKVYIVGEQALRQTYRVENHDASKAFEAQRSAQKYAMAQYSSCEWAPTKDDTRFVVKEKHIIGDKNALFHVADYCLKPTDRDECWWIAETADMSPQIKRVGREPSQQEVDQLKEAGRKLQRDSK